MYINAIIARAVGLGTPGRDGPPVWSVEPGAVHRNRLQRMRSA